MSFLSRILFGAPASAAAVLGANALVGTAGMVSPWATPSELLPFVYSDIYGAGAGLDAVTRDTAMMCAPVKRGRGLIVSKLADLPLRQGTLNAAGDFVPDAEELQPDWLSTTHHPQSPWHRAALTLDDLVFYGWSLWVIERDTFGQVADAGRIAYERWQFDEASPTGVSVDNQQVTDPRTVVLFAGPDEGLLITARESIRGWRYMEASWIGRVRNPIPAMVLEEQHENGVTQAEAEAFVKMWAENRTAAHGAVGWLPYGLKMSVHGQIEPDLFDKGRNAARLDIANHLNLPAEAVGGSTATASLTYSTQEGSRVQLVDDLEYWLAPYEAAVTTLAEPGKVIRADRAYLTDADPAAAAPAAAGGAAEPDPAAAAPAAAAAAATEEGTE